MFAALSALIPWAQIAKFTVIMTIVLLAQWLISKVFGVIPLDYVVALFYHVNIVVYLLLGWFLAPTTLIAIQGTIYMFIVIEVVDISKRIFIMMK